MVLLSSLQKKKKKNIFFMKLYFNSVVPVNKEKFENFTITAENTRNNVFDNGWPWSQKG